MSLHPATAQPQVPRRPLQPAPEPGQRVAVDGKFFRLGGEKFRLKGVAYGSFGVGERAFPPPEQVEADFGLIAELGANVIRIYDPPSTWLLDLAMASGLRVLIDVPWLKQSCAFEGRAAWRSVEETVRRVVRSSASHPAVAAVSVANEIPADIVRWIGARRVRTLLERLIDSGREIEPTCLYTYASFPPTEFLYPRNADFVCFNLFLHRLAAFEDYLARLQLRTTKPLVLGEYGLDSLREGETAQAEILAWQTASSFRLGLSGAVVFTFTDEWTRGGELVLDWAFGLTRTDRSRKPAFAAVKSAFEQATRPLAYRWPKVSVVVPCHNGERTLAKCLDSLSALQYPDYEVILVDDGSTDNTAEIAGRYTEVRLMRQPHLGLSVARNTGISASTGEIIAFTDADCRADEDWLNYLVSDLQGGSFVGVGGPNLLPPEDSRVAAAVMASPGGPAHVMLTDREAEHVPGCNMAFYRWALNDVGGFDPIYQRAGDDVDLCWRLQEQGHRIGFSPAGFVWHYRRSTPRAYLRQQFGYGEAEALLARKHPEHFNVIGGGLWRGRLYGNGPAGLRLRRPIIYHGTFGAAPFQKVYASSPEGVGMVPTSLEYHVLVTIPLIGCVVANPALWPALALGVTLSLTVCVLAACQASLPRGKEAIWSRPLIALFYLLQPLVRGWARYRWRFAMRSVRPTTFRRALPAESWRPFRALRVLHFHSVDRVDRHDFLRRVLARWDTEGWQWKADAGWGNYDVEVYGPRWSRLRITTVADDMAAGGRVIRCRLFAQSSLRARLFLSMLLAGFGLVLEAWAGKSLLAWLPGALFPIWVWCVESEKHLVSRLVAAAIADAAGDLGMNRLDAEAGEGVRPGGRSEL